MRVTRRMREEAAMVCALIASNPQLAELDDPLDGASGLALSLYAMAYVHAKGAGVAREYADAEAEAMLRTGWTPEGWT